MEFGGLFSPRTLACCMYSDDLRRITSWDLLTGVLASTTHPGKQTGSLDCSWEASSITVIGGFVDAKRLL